MKLFCPKIEKLPYWLYEGTCFVSVINKRRNELFIELQKMHRDHVNSRNKFHTDFRFQLTWEEMNSYISWSKKSTLNEHYDKRGTNIKYLPYAFTAQGIYMLMTVLTGDIATEQSN